MSFRKYGGTQFARSHNIVKSNVNTTDSFYVTQNVGQPNTYINFESDISGNMNIYGDLDISGNLNVQGNINFDGDLTKNDIPYNPGGSILGTNNIWTGINTFSNQIVYADATNQTSAYTGAGILSGSYTSSNITINSVGKITAISNGSGVSSQWTSISGGGIYYNLGGNVGIGTTTPGYTLDINGNLRTNADASINSLTVGIGAGNNSLNTAVGNSAFYSNTTGVNNVAVGYQALYSNTIGEDNTAFGFQSLYTNSTGDKNVAIGSGAMASNQSGSNNSALGYGSILENIAGSHNTGFGSTSLYNTLGSYNSGFGDAAGTSLASGNNNTFLGTDTDILDPLQLYNDSTAIGIGAIIDASNQIVLGRSSEKVYIPGSYVGIGVYSPASGYKLDVNGAVNAASYNTPSDYRIKKDVVTLDETFTVDKLRPVTYNNTKLDKQDIGLIAHELQEIYPFLVNGEKDGENFQTVNYTGLIGILIKEIQELKERVKKLENPPS